MVAGDDKEGRARSSHGAAVKPHGPINDRTDIPRIVHLVDYSRSHLILGGAKYANPTLFETKAESMHHFSTLLINRTVAYNLCLALKSILSIGHARARLESNLFAKLS